MVHSPAVQPHVAYQAGAEVASGRRAASPVQGHPLHQLRRPLPHLVASPLRLRPGHLLPTGDVTVPVIPVAVGCCDSGDGWLL